GEVTSGNFSPMLGQGIALAFLPPSVETGAAVTVDVRGRPVAATVVQTPFIAKG
ncbi:MAG: glycine cleavage system protein T, partial [Acidimicrobiia bacterium]|nr:glycine cleavage system protein T [Acidimicrobiia bacterium]